MTKDDFTKRLLELGLLKQYKPHAKGKDPAVAAADKNHPYPKGAEYFCPVKLAGDVLQEADRTARGYKRNKRKAVQRNPEPAKRAFRGARKAGRRTGRKVKKV